MMITMVANKTSTRLNFLKNIFIVIYSFAYLKKDSHRMVLSEYRQNLLINPVAKRAIVKSQQHIPAPRNPVTYSPPKRITNWFNKASFIYRHPGRRHLATNPPDNLQTDGNNHQGA